MEALDCESYCSGGVGQGIGIIVYSYRMARIEVARPHKGIELPYNVIQVKKGEIKIQPIQSADIYTLKVGDCITFVEHSYDSAVDPVKYYDIYHSGKIVSLDTNYIRYLENGEHSFIGISYSGLDSQKKATDWSTIQKVSCYTSNSGYDPLKPNHNNSHPTFTNTGAVPKVGGKKSRRRVRRRKNRRTRSRK